MSTATAVNASSNADPYAALRQQRHRQKRPPPAADRFLTMLVTQLQNQDPLNPMDNAQVTSQMAQINAVTGLEKVNESVKALGTQFAADAGDAGRGAGRPRRHAARATA
jgi:flagellar basal-body rod modification protein FlgD